MLPVEGTRQHEAEKKSGLYGGRGNPGEVVAENPHIYVGGDTLRVKSMVLKTNLSSTKKAPLTCGAFGITAGLFQFSS